MTSALLLGESPAIRDLRDRLARAALSPYPVLLVGESGTGKELAARTLHEQGRRRESPFVAVNCGAFPDTLLASELFGHEPGAFTGADRARIGLFESARGGTLFLDEIGTMSPSMQESLLRVLQEGELRPLGSHRTVRTDVRIVAATNLDPLSPGLETPFRPDLYYRLAVLRFDLPPLRERPEDLPILTGRILERILRELGPPLRKLSPASQELLRAHDWPGNVRELENVLRSAAVLSAGEILEPEHLSLAPRPLDSDESRGILSIEEYVRRTWEKNRSDLHLQQIAERLGISRKTLWKMRRHWRSA